MSDPVPTPAPQPADAASASEPAPAADAHSDDATLASARPTDSDDSAATLPPGAPPSVPRSFAAFTPGGVDDGPRFTVREELARGGMGRVLVAFDRAIGREVALKEMLELGSHDLRARFEREALLTARLQHPAIVSVYDVGRRPTGEPYLVMRRIVGEPLAKAIAKATTLDERMRLLPNVLAAVDAIAYAHGQDVVHRDLKPANILVGEFGDTVVIDWGLAKVLGVTSSSDDAVQTRAGAVMGTPAYMAPEQALGESSDRRTDVYALGVVLYEVLTGRVPFKGEKTSDVLAQIVHREPPRLDALAPGVPAELVSVIQRAMQKNPDDRYPTARALADDLRDYQAGKLLTSHQYTGRELLTRWLKKHRAVLSVALAALAALGALAFLSVRRIVQEREVAKEERELADAARQEGERKAVLLRLEHARSLVYRDPTEALSTLLSVPLDGRNQAEARLIAEVAFGNAPASATARLFDEGIDDLVGSDDGVLTAVGDGGRVRRWNTRTGEIAELFRPRAPLASGRLGALGKTLVARTADGAGRVIDLATGLESPLGFDPGPSFVLSPDALVLARVGATVSLCSLPAQRCGADVLKASGGIAQLDRTLAVSDGTRWLRLSPQDVTLGAVGEAAGLKALSQDSGEVLLEGKGGLAIKDLATGAVTALPLPGAAVSPPLGRLDDAALSRTHVALSDGTRLVLLERATGRVRVLSNAAQRPHALRFAGPYLVAAVQRTLHIWGLASTVDYTIRTALEQKSTSWSGAWALAAQNGLVRVWELGDRGLHHFASTGPEELLLVPAGEGQRLYRWGPDGMQACDLRTGECPARIALQAWPASVATGADTKTLSLLTEQGALLTWDGVAPTPVRQAGPKAPVTAHALSDDGARLAALVRSTGEIWLWEDGAARLLSTQRAGEPVELRFCGKDRLAVQAADGRVLMHHLDTGATDLVRAPQGQTLRSFRCAAALPRVALETDVALRVVGPAEALVHEVPGALKSWDLSPDGRTLLLARPGGELALVSLDLGTQRSFSLAHAPDAVAMNRPWSRFLTVLDGVATLWDAASGASVELRAGDGSVTSAVFARDDRTILLRSELGQTVHVTTLADDLPEEPVALQKAIRARVRVARRDQKPQ